MFFIIKIFFLKIFNFFYLDSFLRVFKFPFLLWICVKERDSLKTEESRLFLGKNQRRESSFLSFVFKTPIQTLSAVQSQNLPRHARRIQNQRNGIGDFVGGTGFSQRRLHATPFKIGF